ncbi:GDP-mannose 4,6-dehydratase [Mechercharimyces sp. CAU 1602]|uniref:GDP-mannose 4,6-dehydratase n=1 Tax=Mechercharimyces sp. CAU 1602 TaxID=2973933 RepID=UPI002162F2C9|nr:GDP-mannose 4,6-dehydratase [Mechercharimyces sp. CAU 1602]MCS1350162.1 GDP-mannose 4,6-dehydratase [Mechercharimyces sp. CAU 1602]
MNKGKVWITGVSGFVGRYLIEELASAGFEVIGTGRSTLINTSTSYQYKAVPLKDRSAISNFLQVEKPDYVIHLAGQKYIPYSWEHPIEVIESNVISTLNILEAIRLLDERAKVKVLLIGSGSEYFSPPGKSHVFSEKDETHPPNPYSWSKWMQSEVGKMYTMMYGLSVVTARTFNLFGPGANGGISSALAEFVASCERERRSDTFVIHGSVELARDFLDVRDAVRAYRIILEKFDQWTQGEVINVCSGQATSLDKLIQLFFSYCSYPLQLQINQKYIRKGDVHSICGNNNKLKELSWEQKIPLKQTVKDMVTYCKQA